MTKKMKLNKKQEKELIGVYDTWLRSYLNGDVKTYHKYLDKDYHFIGSTDNEEFLNKKDTTTFFEKTADQLAGKTQLRNETKIIEKFEELVFITHLFDAWFLNGTEWNYYGRFRFSNALKKNKEGWRFIYQHFSTTDSKADDGETIGFNKISAENLQLQEAVKRRTIELEEKNRELEVETALERIRAQAVAMKTSSDLLDIVVTMRNEFTKLGHEAHYFWHMMWLEDKYEKAMTSGDGTKIGFVMKLPRHIHGSIPLLAKWEKSKKPTVVYTMNADEAIDYIDKMVVLGDFKNIDPQAPSHDDIKHIGGLTFIMARTTHGEIGYSLPGVVKNPPAGDIDILIQFAGAFDLAHRRFLDLQKAEKQAREAQIENALEKVRSRSLAMHKPDELQEVIAVVAEKLKELGVIFDAGGVILCTYFPDNKDVVHWIAVDDFSSSGRYFVPYFDNPIFNDAWDSKIKGDAYFSKEFPVEAKNEFFKHAFENSDYRYFPDDYRQHVLKADKHNLSAAWSKNSAIIIPSLTGAVPSESNAEIMKRFAKVFEQAYIRFMDLQKAEERARESQIDIALERVRSRTLAMQTSEELAETSMIVFQRLIELGIAPNRLFIGIIKDKGDSIEAWATNEDGSKIASRFTLQASKNKSIKKMITGLKQDKKSLVIDMKGKELQDYFQYLNKEMNIPFIHGLEQKRRVQTVAYFSGGLIGMATPNEQPEDSIHLLERFASVFNLTYTRFKDLKVAEAQSKKAEEDLINLQLAKKSAEDALSELQNTQKQLVQSEKMASLGELTAGIAHEIQNPLNFVNNFSEVSEEMVEELADELKGNSNEIVTEIMTDLKQNLNKITTHGKRASSIVKGMLDHSRTSSGIKELTDINILADEFLRLSYHGLRAKDKTFNADFKSDLDQTIPKIEIVAQDIGRVILNLINNAFYACAERSRSTNGKNYKPLVTVSTTSRKSPLGDLWVEIIVKDNGSGIPDKIKDKIFQPFFTTKPTGEGTGLGLSLAYDIITNGHGGSLTVDSKKGKFTKFTISI